MNEAQRLMKIKEDISSMSQRKIRLEERFKNEKEKLESLLKQITDKGYDPKKLSEIRGEKEQDLKKNLDLLESKIEETSKKLSEIEAQNASV